jgi:hypothetical protein
MRILYPMVFKLNVNKVVKEYDNGSSWYTFNKVGAMKTRRRINRNESRINTFFICVLQNCQTKKERRTG